MRGTTVARRVLFICPTGSVLGGLQSWLDALCAGLSERGWEPLVGLVNGPSTHRAHVYQEAHPGLESFIIEGSGFTMATRVRAVMRAIRRVRPEFYVPLTVIDAHDALCALKLQGDFKGRYVLSLHGNLPQQIADATLFQAFADGCVSPGALTCRMAVWGGMPQERVFHVPNGVDVCEEEPAPKPRRRALRLAYVGRLTEQDKRVMDMPAVVQELEARGVDFTLDVVGSGPCEAALREALAGSVERGKVRLHGFVEPERLRREFYGQWDVLLMFSQSEAFGISLVEAMTHGVVPVSSQFVGHRSEGFLREGETARLFDIGDARGCARAVQELAEDREQLERLAKRAWAWVREHYSWERCTRDWVEALETIRRLPQRACPDKLPRVLDEGHSLAGRWPWLPKRLSDAYYAMRLRLRGVPEVMRRGEEWPMFTRCFDEEALARVEAAAVEREQRG